METLIVCFLVLCMCVLSLRQTCKRRTFAASIFAIACATHLVFFNNTESDILYYLSDGVCSTVALFFLCTSGNPGRFTDNMIYACIASLLLSIYGLTIYEFGAGPISYNMTFYALYAYVVLLMTKREGGNGDTRLAWFYMPHSKFTGLHHPLYKKAKL